MTGTVAVILAAGRARRLQSSVPKGLVSVGSETVVGRLCRQLLDRVEEVVVVTGHRADELEAALARPGVRFVRNPIAADSDLGWSCGVGLGAVGPAASVLVVLGDTITDPALFDRALGAEGELNLCMLDVPLDEESMKIRLDEGQPVRMGKALGAPVHGEFSGVMSLRGPAPGALAAAIGSFDPQVDLCHGPLNQLLAGGELDCRAVDCTGLRWIEIDFPEDVVRMRALFPGDP